MTVRIMKINPTRALSHTHTHTLRVNGILATSRTIGDGSMKVKSYITAEPEMVHRDIQPGDQYVVLATDGLWDVMSNQQASAQCMCECLMWVCMHACACVGIYVSMCV